MDGTLDKNKEFRKKLVRQGTEGFGEEHMHTVHFRCMKALCKLGSTF
jgi:hypothetical protein